MPYKMRTPKSCGTDALFAAAHALNPLIAQEQVDRAWGIGDITKFSNLGDTPLNHFAALERLGLNHELISSEAICQGRGIDNQTVILIHNVQPDADVRSLFTELAAFLRTNLEEHWIVLESILRIGDAGYVNFHFGDGSVRKVRFDQFHKMFNSGVVRCAYVVGRGSRKVSWFAKLWGRITGKFY